MTEAIKLPVANEFGFYEIRLESIGGLGANVSGKILGEVGALYLGLNSSNFASYGSEKKGTPVKSFVRWCDASQEIRVNSPIEKPHILALFHENLVGKIPVMAGIDANSKVIVNTDNNPEEVRDFLELHAGTVICVDALNIALEEKTRINMVMLGAIAKASGFIPLEALETVVKDTIGKKYPAVLEGNLKGLRRGYEEVKEKHFDEDGKYPYQEFKEVKRDWGWDNGPLGGNNPNFGSTISNDVSASRVGYAPIFDIDKCIHCGMCDTTCPDMVFQFVEGEYRGRPGMVNLGPDYHHCKGCLRCVEACPTDALTAGLEREHDLWKNHVRNQDLIVDHLDFEDFVGPNSIQTSEADNNTLISEE